jgi:hypothetical protein
MRAKAEKIFTDERKHNCRYPSVNLEVLVDRRENFQAATGAFTAETALQHWGSDPLALTNGLWPPLQFMMDRDGVTPGVILRNGALALWGGSINSNPNFGVTSLSHTHNRATTLPSDGHRHRLRQRSICCCACIWTRGAVYCWLSGTESGCACTGDGTG